MSITITENARREILSMLENEEGSPRFRFGVKGGGCSGLSYALGFDDEINPELDFVADINDIPVVINKQDMAIVENTEIDFKQNMMGGGFVIKNPNAVFSCGCGSSFRTEDFVGQAEKC